MARRARDLQEAGMTPPLITGPGRSGTHYMAELLCRLGVNATHETRYSIGDFGFARDGCVTDVEVSWPGACAMLELDAPVAVQLRDPRVWLPSSTTSHLFGPPQHAVSSRQFYKREKWLLAFPDGQERAAAWYLEVLRRGLVIGAFIYFVESVTPALMRRLLAFLGLREREDVRLANVIAAQPHVSVNKKPPELRGEPGENVEALMGLARLWTPPA